jgi:signal transduction histidine kinase/ActR/RegA family two-component response regulator
LISPVHPANEAERLRALESLELLDSDPEAAFDALTEVAGSICNAPLATLTLVDGRRQWFKAARGFGDTTETPREFSFCGHTILEDEMMVVGDALADPRFADNPLVTGAPNIRFYAGIPLTTREGFRIGALCVIDRKPRTLTRAQLAALRDLGGVAMQLIESRVSDLRREKAERLLAESEARLRFALDAAGIGDWDMDLRTNVARRSLGHDRCFGYDRPVAEWGYDTFLAHVHPLDRERVDATYKAALAGGGDYDVEFRTLWPDQSLHWLWSKGCFYFDEAGSPYRVAGIQVDITARKQAEQAHELLEAQLRQSQKMEAIGVLAGGIAHDFNNILGIILGNAELAIEDAGANPGVQDSLKEIRKAGRRARDLVQQILSFSRRQPTEFQVLSLGAVVEEATRLLRATIPARIRLETRIAPNTPAALADQTQIEQVLLNLVANAIDAMQGQPGSITIVVDFLKLDARADADLRLPAGTYARVSVVDTGAGMDEATRQRIFEPFFTTKPQGEGTGLGLSVVHGIVHAHGGEITVRSAANRGTTFAIYLPTAPGEARRTPKATPYAEVAMGRGQRIAYIDDDESLVLLVQRMLERRGYAVDGFVDARAGLAALKADPGRFELVVSDYNMPGMSGIDVSREVRAIRPDLPVALISGLITNEMRERAAAAGLHHLIFKPNAIEELCDAVQRLIGGEAPAA